MRTIVTGRVTAQHLADAELIAGITPTVIYVTDDNPAPDTDMAVVVWRPDPKVAGDAGIVQRDASMSVHADALVSAGGDPALIRRAMQFGSLVYEVR